MSDPIRVAQWATGAIGKTALRGIIDRPDLELVGPLRVQRRQGGSRRR